MEFLFLASTKHIFCIASIVLAGMESTKNTELSLLHEQVNSLEKREARQELISDLLFFSIFISAVILN